MRPVHDTFLSRILAHKAAEVARARREVSAADLRRRLDQLGPAQDFAAALRAGEHVAVISEMKKASPSAGLLRPDFSPTALAASYARHGAAAISVLTDEHFFQGRLAHLTEARQGCTLPLVRKDFVIDEYQVLQARVAGADAVLLIVAALASAMLAQLLAAVRAAGMQALVEVHDAMELDTALAHGAGIIGINNRDLHSFEVALDTTLRLAPLVPRSCVTVAESGIRQRDQVESLRAAGIDAILVGSHLMRQPDPGMALQQLTGVSRSCFP